MEILKPSNKGHCGIPGLSEAKHSWQNSQEVPFLPGYSGVFSYRLFWKIQVNLEEAVYLKKWSELFLWLKIKYICGGNSETIFLKGERRWTFCEIDLGIIASPPSWTGDTEYVTCDLARVHEHTGLVSHLWSWRMPRSYSTHHAFTRQPLRERFRRGGLLATAQPWYPAPCTIHRGCLVTIVQWMTTWVDAERGCLALALKKLPCSCISTTFP